MKGFKKVFKKAVILLSAAVIVLCSVIIGIADEPKNSVSISSPSMTVSEKKTIQLAAEITTESPGEYAVTWTSSDPEIATIDSTTGLATGIKQGRTTITATVEGLGVSDTYLLNVVRKSSAFLNFFEKKQRLSYRYSYLDNYYYTDDRDCWQDSYGFYNLYDLIAPYILLEYDYIRVYFTYQDLDWMIQLWKGQYGLLFYGSEVGVYTKKHSDKQVTAFTHFKCPDEENWLDMEMSLYRDVEEDGNLVYQFTRPKDTYWWCTGFKAGHLNDVEPADELNMTTTIEMKDEEMLEKFTEGLTVCGFAQADSLANLKADNFFVDGLNVHIIWQDISEAENTMAIKTTFGVLASAGFIGFFLTLLIALLTILMVSGFGFIFLIFI